MGRFQASIVASYENGGKAKVKIAYVKWLDARGVTGSKPVSQVNKMDGLIMDTAGMLVSEDRKVIRIAQDIYIYDAEEGPIARDIEIIPQRYVIEKRIIEVKKAQE